MDRGMATRTPEVSYTYATDGQVDQASCRSGDVQGYYPLKAIDDIDNPQSVFSASYTYDGMNRLTVADFGNDGVTTGSYDVAGIGYDKNGNIEALVRRHHAGTVLDNLSYTYGENGYGLNQLTTVGYAAGAREAWDAAGGTFEYDAAGNMIQTPAPYGLVAASYDERNLPAAVEIASGDTTTTVSYRYSASGERTYKKVEGAGPEHYLLDGAATVGVIEGGSLSHWNVVLPSGEVIGRHLASGGRRYYLKDHLGSVRAVVDATGAVKESRASQRTNRSVLPSPNHSVASRSRMRRTSTPA
jgi:hypothetical protein